MKAPIWAAGKDLQRKKCVLAHSSGSPRDIQSSSALIIVAIVILAAINANSIFCHMTRVSLPESNIPLGRFPLSESTI